MNDIALLILVVLACLSLSMGVAKAIFRIIEIYNDWRFQRLLRREAMEANLRG